MIRRLFSVGGFTALSRVAGFVRDVLMAAVLGAGPMSDAFLVAFRLPNHFRAIFAEGAFNAAFLPRYASRKEKEGEAAAQRFAVEVFSWQFAAQIALLLAALAAMPYVIDVLAPGFADDPDQRALAVELARITFPYLLFVALVTQIAAMLNAHEHFWAGAAAPIMLNLAMIGTLATAWLFPSPAHAAAIGVFLAGILELLFIGAVAARRGIRLSFAVPRWTKSIREFLGALASATIGAGSVQIGLFVDTLLASLLPSGDLTALYYADRVNQLPMGIVGVALGVVLLPEMSAKLARDDRKSADRAQTRAVVLGLLLTLPCIAAFFAIPETITLALFAHGNFDAAAAHDSARALIAYGAGLPAFVLMRCISPSFYARGDTATPVRATLVSVAINVALKLVLVLGLGWGFVGLAAGTSVAAWANLALLLLMARRRALLGLTDELRRALPILGLAFAAAALGFYYGAEWGRSLAASWTAWRDEATLLISAGIGGALYLALSLVLLKRPRRAAS